jgi:hypothetical protein
MKNLKLIALLFVCVFATVAQTEKIVDEIYVSAKNGHYFRAERFIDQLRWELKVKEVANLENYKLAYKLMDSVKHYKKLEIPLDVSKALSTGENKSIEQEIKDLKTNISEGFFVKTISVLGKLKIQLVIKDAKENLQDAKVVFKEAELAKFLLSNKASLVSKEKSVNVNAFKIDSLTKALVLPATADNEDQKSICDQEIALRKKVEVRSEKSRFLSAGMEQKKLARFLANPQPLPQTVPKVKKVPTTDNQIKIAALEKELVYRRKASIHVGTYEIQHEYEQRTMLEGAIKKGDQKEIKRIEDFLKGN